MEAIANVSSFHEISLVMLIAIMGGYVGMWLRLPPVVSFIIMGIVVGPSVLGLASSTTQMDLLANLGISLLLFVVGMKLDLQLIRTTGAVAALTGLGQVVFTSAIGVIFCTILGYGAIESTYISIALTFSSTIIIVKMLSDKGEADSLHGRVALGLLIVQDIVAVLLMIGLSAFGNKGGAQPDLMYTLANLLIKAGLLLGGLAFFIRYGVPRIFAHLAQSSEMMMLFAISFAVALSSFCDWMGFSKEMGAFLAGISLASTQYRDMISAQLKGLRDFTLVFFFIGLGAHIDVLMIKTQIWSALLLSAFVLIGNPVIMMAIMLRMGYRVRTSFLAGVTIAQISEFSLILLAIAVQLGHIHQDVVGLVTLVGLITIAASTYMIIYANDIYEILDPWLSRLEKNDLPQEDGNEQSTKKGEFDVILFGLGRYGSNIARGLRQNGISVLGVDFDPSLVRQWQRTGHAACYGDANDTHFPETLPLDSATWVISSLPPPRNPLMEDSIQETLIQSLREHHFKGKIAVTAHTPSAVSALKRAGADLVLLPFHDAAASAVNALISSVGRKDGRQGELL